MATDKSYSSENIFFFFKNSSHRLQKLVLWEKKNTHIKSDWPEGGANAYQRRDTKCFPLELWSSGLYTFKATLEWPAQQEKA